MGAEKHPYYCDIPTLAPDHRPSLRRLFSLLDRLRKPHCFTIEPIYTTATEPNSKQSKPITAWGFSSRRAGPAIWLLAGIHGEEPAGPIAIAKNADFLGQLGQTIPMVIMPLINPLGNSKDHRFPHEHRAWLRGINSVSDSSHLLPHSQLSSRSRQAEPSSPIAAAVTNFVLKRLKTYPPLIAVDLHEDEDSPRRKETYLYSQGRKAHQDPLAQTVISLLRQTQIPPLKAGLTVSDETIKNGIVIHRRHQPIQDSSIDELLANPAVIVNQQLIEKPPAQSVLVLETPIREISLAERVEVHSKLIQSLPTLWKLANHTANQH